MTYRHLWIFVEGPDDEKFIKWLCSNLSLNYDLAQTWQYSGETKKRTINFLKSISKIIKKYNECAYFFLSDINNSPCVVDRKDQVIDKYGSRIKIENVIIVIKEIESWYLAGLDERSCRELNLQVLNRTDDILKEDFNQMIPQKFDSRIDFMQEILKYFSIGIARQKNKSFEYFMRRLTEDTNIQIGTQNEC